MSSELLVSTGLPHLQTTTHLLSKNISELFADEPFVLPASGQMPALMSEVEEVTKPSEKSIRKSLLVNFLEVTQPSEKFY